MAENDKREPLWAFAALDEYCLPSDTVKHTVATRLSGFWRNLGLKKVEKEPESRPNDFERLKRHQLDHAAPLPIWRDAAAVLKGSVAETLSNQGASQSVAVVGAPFSGHAKALGVLTGRAGWRLIAPPELEADFRERFPLDRCLYPRHLPLGDADARKMFSAPCQGPAPGSQAVGSIHRRPPRPGVLDCGSWGWSFLQKVSPQTEASGEAPASKGTDNADVIRVLSWNALKLPSLPSVERPCGAFVLHALLIHNGLPQAILPELLSLGSDRITQALVQLRSAGIVAHRNKRWWVTPLAYPAVRSYLRDENYLTDPM